MQLTVGFKFFPEEGGKEKILASWQSGTDGGAGFIDHSNLPLLLLFPGGKRGIYNKQLSGVAVQKKELKMKAVKAV